MTARDELLEQFLIEGRELVEKAGQNLTALRRQGGSREALDGLFRNVHTLKGSAALFDLPVLTSLLHAAESAMEGARRDGLAAPQLLAAVSRSLDITDAWLDALDREAPVDDLIRDAKQALAQLTAAPEGEAAGPDEATPAADWARELARSVSAAGGLVAVRYTPAGDAYFRGDDPLAILQGLPGLVKLVAETDPPGDAYDPFRCALRLQALSEAPIADVRKALRLVADQVEVAAVEAVAAPTPSADGSLRTLRIDADQLDQLAVLMDELVIAKNALAHETARLAAQVGGSRELANAQAAVERLVGGLHASVTGMRLVTLGHVFSRFPRQVREIAGALGKEVDLVVSGEQVAVDKSVVERLFEPLLHLVRNALDHGIEAPDVRTANGKPPRATLAIMAHARGDVVTIDVTDDGRGIDVARVRNVAIERGVVTREAAEALSDEAAAELIFAPGFSTAREVSNVSGRGVGMDAVRAAISQVGGRVTLENRPGRGLSVRLSLPAHVVLTKILVVKAGGERFGVALDTVMESHRVRTSQVTEIRAGRAYLRRDTVIPLLRLADLLGVDGKDNQDAFPVLNVDAGGEPIGIQIDEIAERVEAPMRPMSGLLAAYPGVVGTVLQGDGQVLLVLDLAELAA